MTNKHTTFGGEMSESNTGNVESYNARLSQEQKTGKVSLYEEELLKIARNAGIGGGGILISSLIAYLSSIIVTRVVGAEYYGIFYLAITIFMLGSLLASLGLNQGMLRYISLYSGQGDYSRIKGIVLFGVRITLVASALIAFAIFVLSPLISQNVFHKPDLTLALRILIVALPFSTLTGIFLSSLQGLRLIKYSVSVKNILQPLSRFILLAIFFISGWKFLGLLWATVLSIFVGSVLAYYFLKKSWSSLERKAITISDKLKIASFSTPLFFEGFLNYFISSTPILILGYFRHSTDVGIYGIGLKLGLLIILPLTSFNMIFAPTISNLYGRNELETLQRLFKTVTKWIYSFSFATFFLIVLFAKPILSIWGQSFVLGANALYFIAIGQLVNASVGSVGYMLMMTGRPKVNLLNSGILCGLTILLSYLLIPKQGLIGAALAAAFSFTFVNLLRLVEVYHFERIHPYKRSILKPLASGVLSALIIYIFGMFYPYEGDVLLSVGLAVLFLFSFVGLLKLFRFDSEDRYILRIIGKKLRFVS